MASLQHEVLVELFKNRPSLAAELLAESLDVPIPPYQEARLVSHELTEVQPAEYRADVVVVLYDREKPIRVNIVEVQLAADPDKRYVWPAYIAVAREEYRCPANLLVVAPDAAVAAWCALPIEMGDPGFVLKPRVLRMEGIPQITDPEEATRRPELALLSAMAYGDTEHAAQIAQAALTGIKLLDDKRAGFYCDILYNSINKAARRALELKMKGYVYTSPIMVDLIQQGLAQGRDEGLRLATRSLLAMLRARNIDVPEPARQRIQDETNMARVERWIDRATTATNLAEVFAEPS